ncbi:MAG: hypothetical protein ISR61_03315 [Desulfobacteraceae bacterium]|uniref:Uncharacterized protein n=1 Tax=Candidatus Desulfacyla euxinica TaxID=2841693 RepID=A0A8J6T7D8_9DELT|nr:hypothetical protein [Candidatus Desulfacyla euxinica]MBL6977951.1 hypothetical protein [Desulfobacteraceae bacterium]MBL7217074.1 hypothetical protein [Desulfobacteraceae bacterium]
MAEKRKGARQIILQVMVILWWMFFPKQMNGWIGVYELKSEGYTVEKLEERVLELYRTDRDMNLQM